MDWRRVRAGVSETGRVRRHQNMGKNNSRTGDSPCESLEAPKNLLLIIYSVTCVCLPQLAQWHRCGPGLLHQSLSLSELVPMAGRPSAAWQKPHCANILQASAHAPASIPLDKAGQMPKTKHWDREIHSSHGAERKGYTYFCKQS